MSSNERQSTRIHVTYTNDADDTDANDDNNKLSMNKKYHTGKTKISRRLHWLVISFLNTCFMSYCSVMTMMIRNVTAVYLSAQCVNKYYIK